LSASARVSTGGAALSRSSRVFAPPSEVEPALVVGVEVVDMVEVLGVRAVVDKVPVVDGAVVVEPVVGSDSVSASSPSSSAVQAGARRRARIDAVYNLRWERTK
jgi:hypothetical protein